MQSYSAIGEYSAALKLLDQHLALAYQQKNRSEELLSLGLFAQIYQITGNYVSARSFYERAIELAGTLGDTQQEALLRNDLAQIIYGRKY